MNTRKTLLALALVSSLFGAASLGAHAAGVTMPSASAAITGGGTPIDWAIDAAVGSRQISSTEQRILREQMQLEVRRLQRRLELTAVFVTHDQEEALILSDRIAVMEAGRLSQLGAPQDVYRRPANRFVADFIGQGAFLRGKVLDDHRVQIELGVLDSTQPLVCCADCAGCVHGSPVDVLLRPDDLVHDDASALRAEVVHKAFRGADILYTLRLAGGARVLSLVPSHHNHAIGERIGIRLDVDHVVTFSDERADECAPAHPAASLA